MSLDTLQQARFTALRRQRALSVVCVVGALLFFALAGGLQVSVRVTSRPTHPTAPDGTQVARP